MRPHHSKEFFMSTSPKKSALHVAVRPHSDAERAYLPSKRRQTTLTARVIVSGIAPHPEYDVYYRGGKTIPNLTFTLFYLGGDAKWQNTDRANIDAAISAAMSDVDLNNVVSQYF